MVWPMVAAGVLTMVRFVTLRHGAWKFDDEPTHLAVLVEIPGVLTRVAALRLPPLQHQVADLWGDRTPEISA